MNRVELLTVEDTFQIKRLGTLVVPDFAAPPDWTNKSEIVTIFKPDGTQYEATAKFHLEHFNISDPAVSIDKRWRVFVCLQEVSKEDIPIGSRVLVSDAIKNSLASSMQTD